MVIVSRGGQPSSSERARSAHVFGFIVVSPRLSAPIAD
jgi:hypothetical protein